MRITLNTALERFKEARAALIKQVSEGGTFERYFVVINDPAREAIATRLTSAALKSQVTPVAAASVGEEKKGGFFSRLFGKG